MENGRMNDYSSADLMAAILDVRDATAFNLTNLETRLTAKIDGVNDSLGARIDGLSARVDGVENSVERLRYDMNRRFDRVDDHFDRLEGRVAALEPHDHSPSS
jgi:hypothetical protein